MAYGNSDFEEIYSEQTVQEFSLDGQTHSCPDGVGFPEWRIALEVINNPGLGVHPVPIPIFGVC
jgi:hypothetical protein